MEDYEKLASNVSTTRANPPSGKTQVFGPLPLTFPCSSRSSCWSGSAGRFPGWKTEPNRRLWTTCRLSRRTSETTAQCTNPPRCCKLQFFCRPLPLSSSDRPVCVHRSRRSASWRSASTLCRPNWGSATDPLSCRQRDAWCPYVCRSFTSESRVLRHAGLWVKVIGFIFFRTSTLPGTLWRGQKRATRSGSWVRSGAWRDWSIWPRSSTRRLRSTSPGPTVSSLSAAPPPLTF